MTEEMYDSDEDQESDEENETLTASTAPEGDVKKLRREAQSLRKRLREAEMEMLKTRFGDDVVALIPEEVTDHKRRVELAERYAGILKPSGSETVETEQASSEDSREETSEEQRKLAAVADGPSAASGAAGKFYTADEIKAIGLRDQAEALKIIAAQSEPDPYGPPGSLRLRQS